MQAGMQASVDTMLARMISIRESVKPKPGNIRDSLRLKPRNRTEEWVENNDVTSDAETTCVGTTIDANEEGTMRKSVPLKAVPELDGLSLSVEETGDDATAKGRQKVLTTLYELDGKGSVPAAVELDSEESPARGSRTPRGSISRPEQDSPTLDGSSTISGTTRDRGSKDEGRRGSFFSSKSVTSPFSSPTFSAPFASPTFTSMTSPTSAFPSPILNNNDGSFTTTPSSKDGLDLVVVLDLGNTSAGMSPQRFRPVISTAINYEQLWRG